jgi:hypothetical protein
MRLKSNSTIIDLIGKDGRPSHSSSTYRKDGQRGGVLGSASLSNKTPKHNEGRVTCAGKSTPYHRLQCVVDVSNARQYGFKGEKVFSNNFNPKTPIFIN